jgi:DHA1 family L-arabinose/isopropyl-beta-D-thiogalactopyranoside export protein-like MFS transporter
MTKQQLRRIGFWRILGFALSAFIFNTTEFIPVALLSDIAESFAMEVSHTGLMITVYAWVVSLMSLPFMLLTANFERKRLLLLLFAIFITSHILTVFAWNFGVLLLARIGVALAHSVFWAITASLVIRVAPKDKKQQALGLFALGSAMAMVLGLPLGRILGQALGWRATFAAIAVLALAIMLLMWKLLPRLPSKNAGSLASLPLLLKRPLLIAVYLLTMIAVAAHFTAYSYIEPFVIQIGGLSAENATAVLLLFGLSGFAASYLFGKFHPKFPTVVLVCSVLLMIMSEAGLLPVGQHLQALFVLMFLWGVSIDMLHLCLQMRVLQLAPDATDVATAIYSGIFNVGIGGGALIGNQVMQHWGLAQIGLVGSVIAAFGLVIFLLIARFAKTAENQ